MSAPHVHRYRPCGEWGEYDPQSPIRAVFCSCGLFDYAHHPDSPESARALAELTIHMIDLPIDLPIGEP